MSRRVLFRGADLARALKAVQGAGVTVGRVEIDADGKIVIISRSPTEIETEAQDGAKAALEALRARLKAAGSRPPSRNRGRPRKASDAA